MAGRYQLGELLGRGGFGAVYSGRESGGGKVAVKVFSRATGLASRAEREARTASKLQHPNIHAVVGVEHDDQNAYLISELVEGGRFDRTELTDEEAVRAVAAVCDALAHAHALGVVHRDVKPANILISDDGDVCLTDFGIARDEDARDTTLDERVLGTLSYMAPEQARGKGATGATDVWAAALTLYARLAGRNPFKARNLAELLEKLASGAPPLRERRPELPDKLTRAIDRALDRDPARRPTAAGFRDLLLTAIATELDAEDARDRAPVFIQGAEPATGGRQSGRNRFAGTHLGRDLRLPLRTTGSLICAGAMVWALAAFPVYPATWSLPLAVLAAVLAWWRPTVALSIGSALLVPAFWNHAQAAGLVWIGCSVLWVTGTIRWEKPRCLSPLLAVPLAMIGLGPAYVLVAATAPTARRRAAEAAAGGVIVLVAGGVLPASATAGLAGANNPLAIMRVLAGAPQATAIAAAMVAFAVLLPVAWHNRPDRRTQAVVMWGVGFGLAVAGLPQVIGAQPQAWVGAAAAGLLAAIIPAALALASPRLAFSR